MSDNKILILFADASSLIFKEHGQFNVLHYCPLLLDPNSETHGCSPETYHNTSISHYIKVNHYMYSIKLKIPFCLR